MEFVCYSNWEQLPDSANLLFAEGAKQSIFLSRPWFENLTDNALEDEQSMLLACVVDNAKVLAILPLMRQSDANLHSLTHRYSSFYSVLTKKTDQPAIMTCLAEGLASLAPASLRLEPLADDDENINRLQKALQQTGVECHRFFRFYNWVHLLEGQTFRQYMAGRHGRVRNTIARKQRKLQREHDYRIQLYTTDDLESALADYHAAYNASWKAHELYRIFFNGIAASLAKPGWLRLAILYIKDKPAAAQIWFVAHHKAYIFRLAYDEAWKDYSPGSILTSYLMQQVIDIDKVEEIDFLTGNEAYKQDWMTTRRQRWGMNCALAHPAKRKNDLLLKPLRGLLAKLKR